MQCEFKAVSLVTTNRPQINAHVLKDSRKLHLGANFPGIDSSCTNKITENSSNGEHSPTLNTQEQPELSSSAILYSIYVKIFFNMERFSCVQPSMTSTTKLTSWIGEYLPDHERKLLALLKLLLNHCVKGMQKPAHCHL